MSVDDDEIEELLDMGGARMRVTTEESRVVLAALRALEDALHGAGWDRPPALYLIHGAQGPLGVMDRVALRQLAVPPERWWPDPGAVLDRLGDLCDRAPDARTILVSGIGRDRMPLGVAFAYEAYVRREDASMDRSVHDDPATRQDEVRIVGAADLDGRQYLVTRSRRDGACDASVRTAQRMEREIAESTKPQVRWLRSTHDEGLPRVDRALRRMARSLAR